jgi:hypothetical protein
VRLKNYKIRNIIAIFIYINIVFYCFFIKIFKLKEVAPLLFTNLVNLTVQFFLEQFFFYRILIEKFIHIFIPNNLNLDFKNSILYAAGSSESNDSNDFNDSVPSPASNNDGGGNKRKREEESNDNNSDTDSNTGSSDKNEGGEPTSKKTKIEESDTKSSRSTPDPDEDLIEDEDL